MKTAFLLFGMQFIFQYSTAIDGLLYFFDKMPLIFSQITQKSYE